MLPPRLTPTVRESVNRLLSDAKRNNDASTARKQAQQRRIQQRARQQTDYNALVRDWFASIPPAARQRRYTTAELVLHFQGRYRARPSIRMVAAALRQNGFTEHRDWSRAGRNLRFWLPPKANPSPLK